MMKLAIQPLEERILLDAALMAAAGLVIQPTPEPGLVPGNFGSSIAVNNDHYLFVGANNTDVGNVQDQGAVYVYERQGQSWQAMANTPVLTVPGYGLMGAINIATDGNWMMASLVRHLDSNGQQIDQSGAVAVYKLDNSQHAWNLVQVIDPHLAPVPGAPLQPAFGHTISLQGDWAFLSAPGFAVAGTPDVGRSFVYHLDQGQWSLYQELTPVLGPNDAGGLLSDFGFRSAISGKTAMIGQLDLFSVGKVQVYELSYNNATNRTEWMLTDILHGDGAGVSSPGLVPGQVVDGFGTGIALDGDWAIIGAPLEKVGSTNYGGAAYFFHRTHGTWEMVEKVHSTVATDVMFGVDASMKNGHALIGDPTLTNASGDAYAGGAQVYDLKRGDFDFTGVLTNNSSVPGAKALGFLGSSVLVTEQYSIMSTIPDLDIGLLAAFGIQPTRTVPFIDGYTVLIRNNAIDSTAPRFGNGHNPFFMAQFRRNDDYLSFRC